mmetsp:Transcript_31470/g.75045  ORF Transcript_31470/g.75045 Transcript_31470/m.75045 type:complete len:276 (+) Transcript_31470:291-1118(+)
MAPARSWAIAASQDAIAASRFSGRGPEDPLEAVVGVVATGCGVASQALRFTSDGVFSGTPRRRWWCDSKVDRVFPKTLRQTARCFSRLAGLNRRPQSSQAMSCSSTLPFDASSCFGCGKGRSSGWNRPTCSFPTCSFGGELSSAALSAAERNSSMPSLGKGLMGRDFWHHLASSSGGAGGGSSESCASGTSSTCCRKFCSSCICSLITCMTRCSFSSRCEGEALPALSSGSVLCGDVTACCGSESTGAEPSLSGWDATRLHILGGLRHFAASLPR